MVKRHHWPSVQDCKLERAISRTLRAIPMLRYRGDCLLCSRPAHDAHTDDCPALLMSAALGRLSGSFAPKEIRHYTNRPSQARKTA